MIQIPQISFVPAQSIDEVIRRLDNIIDRCIQEPSRLGYFAILYREVTEGVKTAIEQGFFDDGDRMEQLDIVFANRYLEAYDQYEQQLQPTDSWKRTFECMRMEHLIIVQHLLLGMNAHINLDLGIAAASICTPRNIQEMKPDFDKINIVIANIYSMMMPRLKKISWPVVMLSEVNANFSNNVLNFSIARAREQAWHNAVILCNAGAEHRSDVIDATDRIIAEVAARIRNPGWLASSSIQMIRMFESSEVAQNLRLLAGK